MLETLTKYNISFQYFDHVASVYSGWAEATFYNAGASNAIINGLTMSPGQSVAINGNRFEIDDTKYNISFSGAGVNSLLIVAKYYTNHHVR